MKAVISYVFLFWNAAFLVYADPVPPAPVPPPAVVLPDLPPAPPPPPPPVQAVRLPADLLYVFEANVDGVIVLFSPDGVVKMSAESGPVKVRGKFVGGDGKLECRTYKGKTVYVAEAAGVGRVELLIVVPGQPVIRRTLDADNSPPGPPVPPPGPAPTPTDPLTQNFQAAYNAEADSDKAKYLPLLAELYVQGATKKVRDPLVVTFGDLLTTMHNAAVKDIGIPETAVPKLRAAVSDEIVAAFGKVPPSSPLNRDLAEKEFSKIGAALGGVKP